MVNNLSERAGLCSFKGVTNLVVLYYYLTVIKIDLSKQESRVVYMKNRKEKIEALLSFYKTTMLAVKLGLLDIMGKELLHDVKDLKSDLLEDLVKEINKGIEIVNVEEKLKALQVINEINEKAMGTALAIADKRKRMSFMKDSEYIHDLTMDLQKMLIQGE